MDGEHIYPEKNSFIVNNISITTQTDNVVPLIEEYSGQYYVYSAEIDFSQYRHIRSLKIL